MLFAERCESERLPQIIKESQCHRFGRRAETLPEDQMLLGLEDVEQVAAAGEAKQDETVPDGRATRARKRRSNRGALPGHLPQIEIVVDIDNKTCPCCQDELHRIGKDKSERPAAVPLGPDLRPPRHRSGSFDVGRLGRPCRVAPASTTRTAPGKLSGPNRSPMKRPCRCLTPGAGAPRLVNSGLMPPMTGHGRCRSARCRLRLPELVSGSKQDRFTALNVKCQPRRPSASQYAWQAGWRAGCN
jgi:hypothetical protein